MKKGYILLLVLCLAFLLAVPALAECEGGDPPLAPDIALRGNPTTGYTWLGESSAPDIAAVVDNGYVADESGKDRVGVGGSFTFRLDGVKPGTATVTFRYARSWEDEANAPEIVYEVLVDDDLNVYIFDNTIHLGM